LIRKKKLETLLKSIAAFAVFTTGLFTAQASTITPSFDAKITHHNASPNHAVFLKCKLNDNWENQSKGIVLSLPKNLHKHGHDFAIVTAHGLKQGQDCYIADFQGHSEKVTNAYFADNYQAGTGTDWALVSFKTLKGNHIERYHVDDYLIDIDLLNNTMVSFAEARGLPSNTQKCRLVLIDLKTDIQKNNQYVSHDCRAIGGQSGSPITIFANGRHRLVGFHLGNIWTLNSPMTGKPGKLNFLRPYDKKMSEDIKRILKDAE